MATMPVRRLGVALLAAAVVLATGTVSAANLTLTAPSHVGAYQQANTKPCTSVFAIVGTTIFPQFPAQPYVGTIRVTGFGCTGASLTVRVTLNNGATNPETPVTGVAGTALNTGIIVDVSRLNVTTNYPTLLQYPIAVLVTGS